MGDGVLKNRKVKSCVGNIARLPILGRINLILTFLILMLSSMSCHMTLVVHPLAFKLPLTLPRIGNPTMSPSGDIDFLSFDGIIYLWHHAIKNKYILQYMSTCNWTNQHARLTDQCYVRTKARYFVCTSRVFEKEDI